MKKRNKMSVTALAAAAVMLFCGFGYAGDSDASVNDRYVKMNAGVSSKMLCADYWIKRSGNADDIVMTADEIAAWNKKYPNGLTVGNKDIPFLKIGSTMSGSIVRSSIESQGDIEAEKAYINGKAVTREYVDKLYENRNTDNIPSKVNVLYGYSVSRQSLRTFPTNDFAVEEPDDHFYDLLVASEFMPFQPLRILHESKDGEWYYVMFSGYSGWVEKKYVALCDTRKEWLARQNPSDFLIVTDREIRLPDDRGCADISGLILPMGTKMELVKTEDAPASVRGRAGYADYIVKIPIAGKDGRVEDRYALVPVSDDVHVGYVAYTHGNVIRLAMNILGDRYGWAGLDHSNDCSGVVREIYSCFGFDLPRTSGEQAHMEGMTSFAFDDNASDKEKLEVLKNAPIGSLIQFRGHIMIYLGMVNDQPYVISATGSYIAKSGGKAVDTNTMMINNMMKSYRTNGKTWLSNIAYVLYCEPEK